MVSVKAVSTNAARRSTSHPFSSHFSEGLTKLIMKIVSFIIAMVALGSGSVAQQQPPIVALETIKSDLALVECKNADRLESVKKLFLSKGANADDIKVDGLRSVENIVVTKKGKTSEIIIIGAHFDKSPSGCGAIDNWTGIVILANLYANFLNMATDKTLVFVGFGREEEGLIGSRAMANAIPKESRGQYCGMVNFDSFGLAYPQVLSNTSSPRMTSFAKELAVEVKMPFSEASVTGADADSSSFLNKEIPSITFHGLSNKWPEILHSSKDKLEAINPQSVLIGYQFGSLYLTRMDPKPCSAFRKA
jgi:hypothetical protein